MYILIKPLLDPHTLACFLMEFLLMTTLLRLGGFGKGDYRGGGGYREWNYREKAHIESAYTEGGYIEGAIDII